MLITNPGWVPKFYGTTDRWRDERSYGFLNTLGASYLFSVGKTLYPGKTFILYSATVFFTSVVNTVNAFSISRTTGEMWSANVLIASWNPSIYDAWFTIDATLSAYAAATTMIYSQGAYLATSTVTMSLAAYYAMTDVNPLRTATNAVPSWTMRYLTLLVVKK